jgi:hypothetical protein
MSFMVLSYTTPPKQAYPHHNACSPRSAWHAHSLFPSTARRLHTRPVLVRAVHRRLAF